jgi:hypothetical protein
VLPGGLAERLKAEARRLAGLTGENGIVSREPSLSS